MRWFGTLILLAAVAYTSRAEQSASDANSLPRPVGVVYLIELISAPRGKAPAYDEELSNIIPESTINNKEHTYLLIRPISREAENEAADEETGASPKYVVRKRRGAYGKSGGGGYGGGGGGGGGGGFGGGGGLGGGKGGGLGGGLGGGGGRGGGLGGGGQGGYGGGSHGGGGNGGYGGGGAGAHASASATASAKAYGK